MADILLDNLYLALLLPFWIFLIIMVGRFFSVYVNKIIIHILTLFSSLFGVVLSAGALWSLPPDKILDFSIPFIKINNFCIECGLYVDRTALIFSLVLFLISFLVQIFSIFYMAEEKKTYRFYALLNLFNFSLAGLFFSPNLFQTYLFWEVVGVVSYLLIGFEYHKEKKSFASRKVFLINRIGDTALLGAIILCSYFIYSYAPNPSFATLSFIDLNTISMLVYAYASTPIFEIICGMFLLAILVKSAQFPFYTWLQDAMEAKLPVSALLHSSTIVASGVFLAIRLLNFYTLEEFLLKIIAIIGLLTALVCSLSACAQTNPKKVLAYSTSAQMGLVFFAIGMLNIKAALAYFIAHAFIKSLLFILLPKENEKWSYIKFVVFLISGLSLSGLLFSGMIVKEMIGLDLSLNLIIILSVISFLTAFYIIRIALLMFNTEDMDKKIPNILELIPITALLLLNIVFYFYLHKTAQYKIGQYFWSALIAWVCVYVLYIKRAFWKVPILYPISYNGFYLDKFYTLIASNIYSGLTNCSNWFDTKVLSNYGFYLKSASGFVKLFDFIESKVMNGTVELISKSFKTFSLIDKKLQNGNIQKYNTYAFVIISVIIILLILVLTAIFVYVGGVS